MTARFIKPDWPVPANVVACCTTRCGGHSAPPYDSFNLGDHVGDDPAAVAANRDRLGSALPAGSVVQWLSQVHGSEVVEAGREGDIPRADAVWSKRPQLACAVLTADCLPVLFCSRRGDRVAAAHAGWRGLAEGVLEATVNALGVEPGELLAWLGPAIGPDTFEVGPEVREVFLSSPGADEALTGACFVPSPERPGHYHADIYALARQRLRGAGLSAIYGGNFCTVSEPKRFFSYRRDGQTGRMASLVALHAP